ncbi:MAG: hypothetical protein NTV21_06205 [Planctomycetota bacterium]|nr:hypothetical protein [Planctomycetota bacterium]
MKFKLTQTPGPTAPAGRLFTEKEQRKFIALALTFVVISGVMVWGIVTSQSEPKKPAEGEQASAQAESSLATPQFRTDELRKLVRDGSREERADIETPALAIALADARLYNWVHYDAMGGRELDAGVSAELLAAPDASRGRIVRLRGFVEELVSYEESPLLPAHFRGRLKLDDGTPVFVTFQTCVDYEFGAGDYVQVDGQFVKVLGREVAGAWLEAPLVVGPRARKSYPAMGKVTSLAKQDLDTNFGILNELASEERIEYWRVISYTRDADMTKVDWRSAPLLDKETMGKLSADPESFLGVPLRIPPCRVMDMWPEAQGENPARVKRLSVGWLSTAEWMRTPNPAILFATVQPVPDYKMGSDVTARGYFVHMRLYESRDLGQREAPVFVLAGMDPYETPRDGVFTRVLAIVSLSLLGLVGLFWMLLRRDSAKSRELDEELKRRRRERRTKATANA